MTTIDHPGPLAVSDPDRLSADRVAVRALQVARRTAMGVLGDAEAAADVAQDVAITAVRRAASLRDPAALDAWVHRIAVRAALREARRAPSARCSRAGARRSAPRCKTTTGAPMTTDTDLLDALAPLRELEPTDDEVARVLASAPRSLSAPRRRPARAVAVVAATAALAGVLAALPGGDASRPHNAHGILQSAGAVAAQQPAPGAYRYTRVLSRFVDGVEAGGERNRITSEQTSENWTSDGFDGRTVAQQGTSRWAVPPSAALRAAAAGAGAVVKPYDGDFRYGDGPLARVPFGALPEDATQAGHLLEAAIRDGRWAPKPYSRPHWAPGAADAQVIHSAVTLLALGNLSGGQRQALFGVLGARPGARALGEVTDAAGRHGVGVALRLPDFGDELRVIIDPETSDILESSEIIAPPPAKAPQPPAGAPKPPAWPPPIWLAERTQVFLSTGSVAALGTRP